MRPCRGPRLRSVGVPILSSNLRPPFVASDAPLIRRLVTRLIESAAHLATLGRRRVRPLRNRACGDPNSVITTDHAGVTSTSRPRRTLGAWSRRTCSRPDSTRWLPAASAASPLASKCETGSPTGPFPPPHGSEERNTASTSRIRLVLPSTCDASSRPRRHERTRIPEDQVRMGFAPSFRRARLSGSSCPARAWRRTGRRGPAGLRPLQAAHAERHRGAVLRRPCGERGRDRRVEEPSQAAVGIALWRADDFAQGPPRRAAPRCSRGADTGFVT